MNTTAAATISSFTDLLVFNATTEDQTVKVVTHDGVFHADETVAVAILKSIAWHVGSDFVTSRSRKVDPEDARYFNVMYVDVNRQYDHDQLMYDHHQQGYTEQYEDGIKLSSAGLIWRHYGSELIHHILRANPIYTEGSDDTSDMAEWVYNKMTDTIKTIDAVDNGQTGIVGITRQVTLSQFISSFNPRRGEKEEFDNVFEDVVEDIAAPWINNTIHGIIERYLAMEVVLAAKEEAEDGVMVLPKFVPWISTVIEHWDSFEEIKVCVYQDISGQWRVQSLPGDKDNPQVVRCPAPVEWRGRTGKEVSEISGLAGCVFCHVAGFIAGAMTQSEAVAMARMWVDTHMAITVS